MIKESDLVRYEALFRKDYATAASQMQANDLWGVLATLATEIMSTNGSESYRWFGELPEFTEWIGDRKISDLKDYDYTLKNKDFQAAVKIFKDDLDDDHLGMIQTQIKGLPAGALTKWGKLVHDLLIKGTTAKAFDGVAFFSAATGNRKFSNLFTGTISAASPTLTQVQKDIMTVRSGMMMYKDANGSPIGIYPDTFVVPPQLEYLFRQAIDSQSDGSVANSGTINPIKSVGTVVVDPGLTDVNDFYALCTKYAVGPFIRQNRQAVETQLYDDTSRTKCYVFGADFRGNAGYAFPCLAAKSVSAIA